MKLEVKLDCIRLFRDTTHYVFKPHPKPMTGQETSEFYINPELKEIIVIGPREVAGLAPGTLYNLSVEAI